MVELRTYQHWAVVSLSATTCGVLVAPAGSGKTIMVAAALSQRLACYPGRQQRVLWLCNTIEQQDQATKAIELVGNMSGAWFFLRCPSGCSDIDLSAVDVLIVDECHHAAADTWRAIITGCNRVHTRWGMTATPHREDGLWAEVSALIGPVAHIVYPSDVQAAGKSVPAVVHFHAPLERDSIVEAVEKAYLPTWEEDFPKIKRLAGYKEGLRTAEIDNFDAIQAISWCSVVMKDRSIGNGHIRKRLAIFLNKERGKIRWRYALKLGITENEPRCLFVTNLLADCIEAGRHVLCIIFAKEQGKFIRGTLQDMGIDARLVYSAMRKWDEGDREDIIDGFRRREFPCLIATSLADEGLDIPAADCLVNASGGKGVSNVPCSITGQERPTSRIIQRPGRVLRPEDDKDSATIHDMVDWHHPMLLKASVSRREGYQMQGFPIADWPDGRRSTGSP